MLQSAHWRTASLAKDLFYVPSCKNLGKLFERIEQAKAPDVFTNASLLSKLAGIEERE
jgi:hypothetical protein